MIYDGTLSEDWKVMVTFQQMIIVADQDGVVDITPRALARRTGLPLDIIVYGIEKLLAPDPYSRSGKNEGRRIELLDEHRNWGYRLINYKHYRDLASRADKRGYDKKRYQKIKSESEKTSIYVENEKFSQNSTDSTDTDVDTDIITSPNGEESSAKLIPPCPHQKIIKIFQEIIPEAQGIRDWNSTRQKHLSARWKEYPSLEKWKTLFTQIRESDFLMGRSPTGSNRKPFLLSLDWLCKAENFLKVIEGKYHD
jgi:hypothetical protein